MLKGLGYIDSDDYSSLSSSSSLSYEDSPALDILGPNVSICAMLSNAEMSTTLSSSTVNNANDKLL
jgi:hypothetical protein